MTMEPQLLRGRAAESWDLDADFDLPEGGLSFGETSASSVGRGNLSRDGDDEEGMDWEADFDSGGMDVGRSGTGRTGGKEGKAAAAAAAAEGSFELDDIDSSFSTFSSSSSGKQATLKASTLKNQAGASDPTAITPAVLAVLASGVKGTVTRLQPTRKVLSPKQAAIDWDEDIEMPDTGLTGLALSTKRTDVEGTKKPQEQPGGTLRLKPKASFASAFSDDLDFGEDDDMTKKIPRSSPLPSRTLPSSNKSSPRFGLSPGQRRILPREPEPSPEDLTEDFDLPTGLSRVSLAPSLASTASRPGSMVSIDELDQIRDDDDSTMHPSSHAPPPPPSFRNKSGSTLAVRGARGRLRSDTARSRPSLTPSLTTDRSSSPFTEPDFDEDEGFFDDLELPPEFGKPPKGGLVKIPPEFVGKGKEAKGGKSDLQLWLEERLRTRAAQQVAPTSPPIVTSPAAIEPPPSSPASRAPLSSASAPSKPMTKPRSGSIVSFAGSSTKIPRRTRTTTGYEDRHDERVEDGLEITAESLRADRLRTRTNSLASTASTRATQRRTAGGQAGKRGALTSGLAFPSATTGGTIRGPPGASGVRHTRASLMRTESASRLDLAAQSARPVRPSLTSHQSASMGLKRPLAGQTTSRPTSTYGRSGAGGQAEPMAKATTQPGSTSSQRFRTTSLRPSMSSASLASMTSATSNSYRAGGAASPIHGRPGTLTRPATASGFHAPPPSSSSQRLLAPPTSHGTLQRKRSAANLRINPGFTSDFGLPTSGSTGTPPVSSGPPSPRKGLTRKQSMPALRSPAPEAASLDAKGLRASAPHRERPASRAAALPSYAEPTASSLQHQALAHPMHATSSAPLPSVAEGEGRHRRAKRDLEATLSPSPSLPSLFPQSSRQSSVTSRLTMPTISSRMKSKPSIIHEEGIKPSRSGGSLASSSPGTPRHILATAPAPQQLRRPKRMRQYGDGTELDAFDDLPTNKDKERKFLVPKGQKRHVGGDVTPTVEVKPATPLTRPVDVPGKGRLMGRKTEQTRRREREATKKQASKKGLITKMSMTSLPKAMNTGEMRWNHLEKRWEGNDQEAQLFENTLASSARPALITNPSYQSPGARGASKAQVHVVGDMVFDPIAMCWHSRVAEGEDELDFGDDEEESFDRMAMDDGASSTGGMSWDAPGQRETTMRLKNRASWMGDIVMGEGEDVEDGAEHRQEGAEFWKQCSAAEERHREETKWWIPNRQSDDVDRSYLQEIRKLVTDQ